MRNICCTLIPEKSLIPENLILTQKHSLHLSRKIISYLQGAIVLLPFLKLIWAAAWQKPTKWPVRLAKTPISLGIRPVWSESSLCTLWVAKDPVLLQADSEDWSDSVNGQACQSLRWAYRSFSWFCRAAAHFILLCENIYENDIIACR